jgi:septal ring factor EnvC (AmiA/AmiB activator)
MPNKGPAHRTGALALLVLLWAFPTLALAANADSPRESLEQLQDRIASLKKDLESTQEAHSDAADGLKQSERAISEANRKLYEIRQQQKSSRTTLQELQQEKTGLEQTIQNQQQLLGKQLYQQYLNRRQGYLQIALTQQNPNAIAREMQYYSYIARARVGLIKSLRSNLDRVAKLNDQTAATLEEITNLKLEQEKQRQQLESEKRERKTVMQKLAAQIKVQRGEISKLRRDEKRLTQLMERLSRIVTAPPKRPQQENLRKNETLPTPGLTSINFAALKGKLHLPVRGSIANRFGAAREDSGISWKGLFIKAGEGAEVKSIADGRVVFADWLRGFGNLMILDHGDGFMSLYGNNQALLRKVGDEVRTGDGIASVGSSGGIQEPGLYFEMRHQSKPFDPLNWCVVK